MKKIRMSVCVLLIALSACWMTACGNSDKNATEGTTTTAPTTQAATTNGSTEKTTTRANESSTGVVDGMVDDVEKGIGDMTDDMTGNTNSAVESR